MNSKIVVLGTGGTIAGTAERADDTVGYSAAQLGVAEVVAQVPALQGLPLVTEQVAQLDSKDMSLEVWRALAQRCAHWLAQPEVQGIVVTHGTDTVEETAFFLQAVLDPAKPIVLACAMRPATAITADGPQNLLDAVTVAATPGARGVTVVCAGTVHSALDVQKAHTYRLDAFGSGDAGPVGYVEDGRVRLLRGWPQAGVHRAEGALPKLAGQRPWPRVEIVMNYAGASGAVVQALMAQGVQGLVAAGTGNASVHQDLEAALLAAQAAGVRVALASRCASGPLLPRPDGALALAPGLSPVKARVALLLALL